MAVATLKIIPGTLPTGYCWPTDPQTYNNDILSRAVVNFESSSFTVVIVSSAQPAATDRDKLWLDTDNDRIYRWDGGAWIHRHPYEANGKVRLWYAGTLTELLTFDGGASGTVGASSGPMWEEDTTYQGRFPLHAGALPTSATVIGKGDTGGVDQVTLASNQLPDHTHLGKAYVRISGGNQPNDPSGLTDDGFHENSGHTHGSSATSFDVIGVQTTSLEGTSGEAFDSLNPYKAGYWIKRTGRLNYKGS